MVRHGRFGKVPRVFVSYRRDDSSGYAGRLYADLSEKFGADNVFIDIDSLVPGADFVDAIEETLASCDFVLVVIGRSWLSLADAHGKRRLDNDEDFVCMEVGHALDRSIGVIPVLVGGAAMPGAEELPQRLTRLARRHAMELSDRRWPADVQDLLLAIQKAKARSGGIQNGDATQGLQVEVDYGPIERTAPLEVVPPNPSEEAPKPKRDDGGDAVRAPSGSESAAGSPDMSVKERSVEQGPLAAMASSTTTESHPPTENTHRSKQSMQQGEGHGKGWVDAITRPQWRQWADAIKRHQWRNPVLRVIYWLLVGIAVLALLALLIVIWPITIVVAIIDGVVWWVRRVKRIREELPVQNLNK